MPHFLFFLWPLRLLHPLHLPPILPPSCKPRNWFCYQFKQIFRNTYQYFEIYTAFFKISGHCKADSRHAAPMPLHQTYCFICFYSYVKFYCPKVRWSWVLWAKKVLFHVIKAWYCLEYVFNSLKLKNFNGWKICSNESWIIEYNILKPIQSDLFFTTP